MLLQTAAPFDKASASQILEARDARARGFNPDFENNGGDMMSSLGSDIALGNELELSHLNMRNN